MDSSRLRSRPAILLLTASLMTSLVLGILVVVTNRVYARDAQAAAPLSDDQARRQVVDSARDFVQAGKLRAASGGYLLKSCSAEEQPPYQGSVYVNFDVPTIAETSKFFRGIAREMAARGWHEGVPPGRHPGGHTLARNGLIAVYYRDPDQEARGVLQIHGECLDFTDHRSDSIGFVDITGELNR